MPIEGTCVYFDWSSKAETVEDRRKRANICISIGDETSDMEIDVTKTISETLGRNLSFTLRIDEAIQRELYERLKRKFED